MNIEEFVVQLRIEKDNRNLDKCARSHTLQAKANMVNSNNKSKKRKHSIEPSKKNLKKFKGNCYNCGNARHHSIDCCKPIKQAQANITKSEAIFDGMSNINSLTIISECNNVGNPMDL